MAGHEVPHRRAGDAGQLLGGLVAGSGDHRLDSRIEIRLGAPALPSSGHRAPPGQELSRSPLEAGIGTGVRNRWNTHEVHYLFLDAIFEPLRAQGAKEALLVVTGPH